MTVGEDGGLADTGRAPDRSMSTLSFVLVVTALTVVAAAAGFFGGLQILSSAQQGVRSKADESPAVLAELQRMNSAGVKVLSPIVTNLAGSPPVWIRLESSLVFRDDVPSDADALAAKISEDIVAFLRTIPVEQIEGALGFQHLCEDLNDRVRVRSNGRVQELIVQGLIIE